MSAETIITTATTIAVRALIDGIAALRENAKADERAEIDRLLARLHETAPEPVASSLDGITDRYLRRFREREARLAANGFEPVDPDRLGTLDRLRAAPLTIGAPVEGEDPDQ